MKRKRFTEEQIIGVLKQAEAGTNNQEICRKNGITEQTFFVSSRGARSRQSVSRATLESMALRRA